MATSTRRILQETNEQFVVRIMNYGCPTGMLIQPFVINALEKYSAAVARGTPEKYDSDLLCGVAWIETAKWLKKEIDAKYKS